MRKLGRPAVSRDLWRESKEGDGATSRGER